MKRVPQLASLLGLVVVSLLGGCAASTIVHDYKVFSKSYAEDMNWQILMNLARLDQGHPPYFVGVGPMTLMRESTGGIGLDYTDGPRLNTAVITSPGTALTRLWKPALSTKAQPTVQYLPMSSEENTRQLLAPMPSELLLLLHQQGWRIDHLLRLLVDRVEIKDSAGNTTDVWRNRLAGDDKESAISFLQFLNYCHQLHMAQLRGYLAVESVDGSKVWYRSSVAPDLKQASEAADAGRLWRKVTNQTGFEEWELITPKDELALKHTIPTDPNLKPATTLHRELPPLVDEAILQSNKSRLRSGGVYLRFVPDGKDGKRPGGGPHLYMRSYRRMLEAVANEQVAWQTALLAEVQEASKEEAQALLFRPILVFSAPAEAASESFLPPAADLTYGKKRYWITDRDAKLRWNHDVFRLIVQLSAHVSVDISKFQQPILRVSQ